MKKVSFALSAMLLVIPLSACSGKPDASDVEKEIKEFWAPCKLVKVTDVKKTNGVDQGERYQMAISYKLELVQDVAEEDVWGANIPPLVSPDYSAPDKFTPEWEARNAELNAPHREGKKRIGEFIKNNCPGPKGSSRLPALVGSRQLPNLGFIEVFIDKYGSSLPKGESVEQSTEFSMVKTENGWMAQ